VDRRKILGLQNGTVLDDIALNNMHAWSTQNIDGWLSNLEQSANVFFCWPLDLDLAMLDAFPQQYKSTITGTGPRMSPPDAAQVVLGSGGPGLTTYVGDLVRFVSLMPEYRYHFLTHSKPATHISALANISPQEIQSQIPAHLRRVLEHIQNHLSGL
jgi:putative ATP-dependent endonuclease of OLD family